MTFPPASAGPNAVRDYISDILVAKHDTTADFAKEVASRWQLGRPNDLRHASTGTFERVFGKDIGHFLYRTVQEDIREQWYNSTAGAFNSYPASADCIASLRYAGAAFGPPMVFCGIQDPYSQWRFPRLFLGGIVSFLAVLAFLVASIDRRMEKQKAETEDKKKGEVKQKE
ncbi:hypothetical protein P875_00064536 [Aspergillus parasiticus SU-1]|uniref:Uncharacterized protein n=1 Tax=Aspergillus parasiticus (strain ATCC 56775 / NRRL 5862 / SRRC 143 / SU-1) TaxID=1403190 RepID=A0A0F0I8D0_ASPPU|nr:hypothetical protein P875_00064536 [Aspergillus parasiticus SU-1]